MLADRANASPSCRSSARPSSPTARAASSGRSPGRSTRSPISASTATPCRRRRAARTSRRCAPPCCARCAPIGELTGNKKGVGQITADDLLGSACALLSLFTPNPQFQGQTKDRLVAPDAGRQVEVSIKDHFDHWLSGHAEAGRAVLEHVLGRAEERMARKRAKEVVRKTATRKLRLPGKLADCSADGRGGHRDFSRRGQFRRRLGQAGTLARDPGDPAAARQDPERRQRQRRQAARQQGARRPRHRARLRPGPRLSPRRPALRQGHHHDRCRRRRLPHRRPADDLLPARDAEADRGGPPLSGAAAALPPERQAANRATPATMPRATALLAGRFKGRKVETSRFKGWARWTPSSCARPPWIRRPAPCCRSRSIRRAASWTCSWSRS